MSKDQAILSIPMVSLANILNALSTEEEMEAVADLLVELEAVPESDDGCFILPCSLLVDLCEEELPGPAQSIRRYLKKNEVDLQGSYMDVSGLFF
jgi:hypothetical protein